MGEKGGVKEKFSICRFRLKKVGKPSLSAYAMGAGETGAME